MTNSRLAYSEILTDEQGPTVVAFRQRAQAFLTAHGITVHRMLTDNGSCYRSPVWRRCLVRPLWTVVGGGGFDEFG